MVNYASMAGWGQPLPVNPYTGQPDRISGLASSSPEISAAMQDPGVSAAVAAGRDGSMWDSLSSWMDTSGVLGKKLADGTQMQGWGLPALNIGTGLASAYFGNQQLKLAQDSLAQNKKQFQLNFDAQKKTTNSALSDRQSARVASNPGAYQSVGDYMNKYGI